MHEASTLSDQHFLSCASVWLLLRSSTPLGNLIVLLPKSITLLTLPSCAAALVVFAPNPPPLWIILVSICAFLHHSSQCDGAWRVPLTGCYIWSPSRLTCGSLWFHQAPSPHLSYSTVDMFETQNKQPLNVNK